MFRKNKKKKKEPEIEEEAEEELPEVEEVEEEEELEEDEIEEEEKEVKKKLKSLKKKPQVKQQLIVVNELPTQAIRSYVDEAGNQNNLMTRDEALSYIVATLKELKEED